VSATPRITRVIRTPGAAHEHVRYSQVRHNHVPARGTAGPFGKRGLGRTVPWCSHYGRSDHPASWPGRSPARAGQVRWPVADSGAALPARRCQRRAAREPEHRGQDCDGRARVGAEAAPNRAVTASPGSGSAEDLANKNRRKVSSHDDCLSPGRSGSLEVCPEPGPLSRVMGHSSWPCPED
jgi:hypothetical protein